MMTEDSLQVLLANHNTWYKARALLLPPSATELPRAQNLTICQICIIHVLRNYNIVFGNSSVPYFLFQ